MSRAHQTVRRGLVAPISEILQLEREWRGEITLVVAAGSSTRTETAEPDLEERIEKLLAGGLTARDATEQLSQDLLRGGERFRRKDLYTRVLLAFQKGASGGDSGDEIAEESAEDDDPPK